MQKRTKAVLSLAAVVVGVPLLAALAWLLTPGYGDQRPWSASAADVAGSATVESSEWPIANEASGRRPTVESVYTVGEPGIAQGGELRVALGWLLPTEQRFYVPFSLTVSSAFFFDIVMLRDAVVESNNPDVTLEVIEPSPARHFAKILQYIRYKRAEGGASRDNLMRQIESEFAVRVRVESGTLASGDTVALTLGATDGLVPPPREAQWQVVWAVDGDADGTFGLPADAPWFAARSASAARVRVIAPTTLRVGDTRAIHVRVEDDYFLPNLVRVEEGEVSLAVVGPGKMELGTHTLPVKSGRAATDPLSVWEESIVRVPFTPTAPGVHRIQVSAEIDGKAFTSTSNPVVVMPSADDSDRRAGAEFLGEAAAPEPVEGWIASLDRQVFFGDTHLHSILSYDADRHPDYVYWRQKNQERHDFAFLTDHDMIGNPGFVNKTGLQGRTDDEWAYIEQLADAWYEPGAFVTLPAHEWTSYYYGHRNVFYGPNEPERGLLHHNRTSAHEPFDSRTPDELRDQLGDRDTLVVPHSTAWPTASTTYHFGDPKTFDAQRLVEIYSTHGASEFYDNEYAVDDGRPEAPTDSKLIKALMNYDIQQAPADSGNFAQDALAAGWRFGFLGSSDMHFLSHIDQAYRTGWAAVWADSLDRESIWEALKARRTYATTGVRIFVRFDGNGSPMGSAIEAADEVQFRVDVETLSAIDRVQIVRYDGSTYDLLLDEQPGEGTLGFHRDVAAKDVSPGMFYYLKVRQTDGHYAWSSPIWIEEKS